MVNADIQGEREMSLPAFLRGRAREASESRLALDVAVGIVAVIVGAALRPEWWMLLSSAGLCLASFGLWATTERMAARGTASSGALRAASLSASMLGFASALATAFFLWTVLMGTWIS